MIKIWGRADGSNVIKAMWCIGELGHPPSAHRLGRRVRRQRRPRSTASKNPNGRLPTLEEEDGWTLWESGAVVRYLCAKHSMGNLCPDTPRGRADAEKWMDWSSLNLAKLQHRLPRSVLPPAGGEAQQEAIAATVKGTAPLYDILEQQLAGRKYLCGDNLTMADIPAGSLTHRWMQWAPESGRATATSRRGTSAWRHVRPTRSTSSR